jgi:hypothetical protein
MMTMTEKIRIPADLDNISLKLLGKFHTKDLIRFATPTTTAFIYQSRNPTTTAYVFLVLAVILGGIWVLWRPWNRPLDQTLYHGIRWSLNRHRNTADTPEAQTGYITTETATAALIKVDPVNIGLKSGSEKAALHKQYQELLQSIAYPITVYSTQHPFNFASYFDSLAYKDDLQRSYRNYCENLVEDSQSQTRHFIEIRVKNGDTAELDNRVNNLLEQLNSGELSAERLTDTDTDTVKTSPTIEYGHITYTGSEERSHSKTLYISEFPRDLAFTWTTSLLQTDGLVDITQVITPENPSKTVSSLQKLEAKAEAENQSLIRKGYGSNRRLERLLDDIDWFQNLLAEQKDQPVKYGVYITAYGETLDECRDTLRQVETRLKTLGIKYCSTGFRTDQSHCTTTPGYSDKLNETSVMPAGSAAGGFPFTLPSRIDQNGALYGINKETQTPVILDRFQWNAGHHVIAGVTGSGKSFHSKLLLLRSSIIYTDLHINIVDPKPEYQGLEDILSDYASVTRYEASATIKDDTQELIQAVEQAYRDAQQTSSKTIVVVDEAHRLLKTEEGASILSTLVREARSSNTAVTLITQTIADFNRTPDGEDILKNTSCKILFAHEQTDSQPLQAFNLSQHTETQLYNLTKGDNDHSTYSEAILTVTNQHESQIKIEATETEKQIIENNTSTTNNQNNTSTTNHPGTSTSQEPIPEPDKDSDKNNARKPIKAKLPSINTPSIPKPGLHTDFTPSINLLSKNNKTGQNSKTSTQISELSTILRGDLNATLSGAATGVKLSTPPLILSIVLEILLHLKNPFLLYIGFFLVEAVALWSWYRSYENTEQAIEGLL